MGTKPAHLGRRLRAVDAFPMRFRIHLRYYSVAPGPNETMLLVLGTKIQAVDITGFWSIALPVPWSIERMSKKPVTNRRWATL